MSTWVDLDHLSAVIVLLKGLGPQSFVMATGLSVGPARLLWWQQGYAEDHQGTELDMLRAIRLL